MVKNMCRSIEEMLAENTAELKRKFALRMIDEGKVPLNEIAEYSGLGIDSVRQLAAEVKK